MVNKIMFVLVRFHITRPFPNSSWSFTSGISFSILLEKVSYFIAILQSNSIEQRFIVYIFSDMKWLSCIIYLLKEMKQAGEYHLEKSEYIERIKYRILRFCFCTGHNSHNSWEETKF